MSEETLRLAIGLFVLGAALIAVSIGLIMSETAAQAAARDAGNPGGPR